MSTAHDQYKHLLSRRQLQTRWNCSGMTLKRRQKAGLLIPIYLSPRMVRYSLQNVEEIEAAAGQSTAPSHDKPICQVMINARVRSRHIGT